MPTGDLARADRIRERAPRKELWRGENQRREGRRGISVRPITRPLQERRHLFSSTLLTKRAFTRCQFGKVASLASTIQSKPARATNLVEATEKEEGRTSQSIKKG